MCLFVCVLFGASKSESQGKHKHGSFRKCIPKRCKLHLQSACTKVRKQVLIMHKCAFFNPPGKLYISPFAIVTLFIIFAWEASLYPFLILLSVLFHELAHIYALHKCHCNVDAVYIYPFGADIVCDTRKISYKNEIIVSLAGVIANFVLFMLSGITFYFTRGTHVLFFCVCNGFFAVTNTIPISTLDGCRALEAFLCQHLPLDTALCICKAVSTVSFAVVGVFFVWCSVKSGNNASVVVMLSYSLLGLVASQRIKKA